MRAQNNPLGGVVTAVLALLLGVFLLSASIAAPILCRPFYYAHITALDLEGRTGLSEEVIRQAYGEMLDFCLGLREDFSTGSLPWSESGKAHFEDVRGLFLLDLRLLALSGAGLLLMLLLCRALRWPIARPLGRGPGFWAAVGLGVLFSLLTLLAAQDFDRAFVVFHSLFFPGKSNWIFDPRTDAIITILPEVFFRNCAILIVALLLLGCGILIAREVLHGPGKKKRKAN